MLKLVERILGILSIVSLAGVIIVVTIQILSRFLPFSYIWTEELTRYLFLFAISFGTPLALIRNEFINVDLLINKMKDSVRRFYDIGIYVTILVLTVVIAKEGYKFMLLGHNQRAATLPIQMSVIHASIFLMGVFLSIFAVIKIVQLLQNKEPNLDGSEVE
ncbi:C4-dicarboxylate ABC transporter permease [Sporosarcina sp. P13]|uniref:TRAP transporter small permease n=1 Tax=Sporosarcina sp. P13 TaxID=2048263 RepID=UPI000C163E65|nr:TRAP transporter small permease [Sporosarcina sp. P13]PIC63817.1 C4-dicarboxylate ABC transporter permease [Sporosarcina sp. P13]